MKVRLVIAGFLLASTAMAEAPSTSLRPVLKPRVQPAAEPAYAPATNLAPRSSPRPRLPVDVYPIALPALGPETSVRPRLRLATVPMARPVAVAGTSTPAIVTPEDEARQGGVTSPGVQVAPGSSGSTPPPAVTTTSPPASPTPSEPEVAAASGTAVVAVIGGRDAALDPTPVVSAPEVSRTTIGKICRDRDLRGTEVGHVPAKLAGCGISSGAIMLYEVSGVELSTPAVMQCDTAKALKTWVEKGMSRAVRNYGGGVVELRVAAGYSCRTRNSQPGAKISEHGRGRAIDISAFRLADGSQISVLEDWGKGKPGRILRKMHKSACGPFGTVLGPNSDRFHRDHFHFDVARHRGGPYCR